MHNAPYQIQTQKMQLQKNQGQYKNQCIMLQEQDKSIIEITPSDNKQILQEKKTAEEGEEARYYVDQTDIEVLDKLVASCNKAINTSLEELQEVDRTEVGMLRRILHESIKGDQVLADASEKRGQIEIIKLML